MAYFFLAVVFLAVVFLADFFAVDAFFAMTEPFSGIAGVWSRPVYTACQFPMQPIFCVSTGGDTPLADLVVGSPIGKVRLGESEVGDWCPLGPLP